MNSSAIINGLINIARRIGRWILRKLLEIGGDWLCGYMAGKIGDMRRRLARAKTERRKRWLRGRIRRWDKALGWLNANRHDIGSDIVEAADSAASSIPMVAKAEREAA